MSRTIEELEAKIAEREEQVQRHLDEMSLIERDHADERGRLPENQQRRFDRLDQGIVNARADIAELREEHRDLRRERVAESVRSGNAVIEGPSRVNVNRNGDPWQTSREQSSFGAALGMSKLETASETRSRALTAIERWNADDKLKESATGTVERLHDIPGEPSDVRGVSEHIIRYSDPLYVSAFRKFARDPETYVADLTPDEARVWRAAREESRAALQTSGSVLPAPLDPTIVLTNDGAVDPMRSVARVDSTTSKSKRYITSDGATFSYDAELAEVSDDTPGPLTEVEINTHKGQGFIQSSIETWMDQPGFDSEVSKIIADGKARIDATKFIKGAGDGSNEPKGIQTALDGTASEIAPTTAETYAVEDVYKLIEALAPRFRQVGRWQLELATLNDTRQFANDDGHALLARLGEGDVERLLGRPLHLNSEIDPSSDIDPAVTADNFIMFYGDWRNYVILDRVGTSVYFVPPGRLVNSANNLPDGRVGWYAFWRTGADVLTSKGIVGLNVATTV